MKRLNIVTILWLCFFFITSCDIKNASENSQNSMENQSIDPHSFAKPDEALVKHIDLDLKVSFEEKIISGNVTIHFERNDSSSPLTLDTKDLIIENVLLPDGSQAKYKLLPESPVMGQALVIELPGDEDNVNIFYHTSEHAEALQWLNPEQTNGGEKPFLFTQSQAILARTWIPLQDSPGIRFSYTAKVKVPEGLMAVMSAENPQEMNPDGVYSFKMEQPIPAYLMSLAVGDLQFAPVSDRTGVYAEPAILDAAVYEFAEMDTMLNIAEKMYGPYQWGRYDVVVLPPSFPFGGMENPRITFATPTVIAGDRSLVSLVAHEMAHSWSGNLVTNGTWNDFWLNEGFTVYFEYRIMEALYGRSYSEMLASLSRQGLVEEVESFMSTGKEGDTKLKIDLSGRNPDDGVTTIAYDKGYFFLRYLEEYAGRETFDAFIKQYFQEHAFRSNTTDKFVAYLNKNLFEKNNIAPVGDLNEWISGTGLPESLPVVNSERFQAVDSALNKWESTQNPALVQTSDWTTHEWLHFIMNLPDTLSFDQMKSLDEAFGFSKSGNSEILGAWFVHVGTNLYEPAYPEMETFLIKTGRRKFLTPIYTALSKSTEGKTLAKKIYSKARPGYHFVAANTIDAVLNMETNE